MLACHFKDFLRLLATNREWEPFDQEFLDAEKSNLEANLAYRHWLKDRLKIGAAKDPVSIMKKANEVNLAFQKWLAQVRPL